MVVDPRPAYDYAVVGSGFGGSVAALRLTQKGYRVLLLEQGRDFADADLPRSAWQARRFLWAPWLGLRGIMAITRFKHTTVLSGVGVGGGSLVYGNTLYEPDSERFYGHPQWSELASWRHVLEPHFATARQMLGVVTCAADGPGEHLMHRIAAELGAVDSVHPTEVGVFLGEPGRTVPDPYFDGEGPARAGCIGCGQCMLGCRHNAKNTLVKNYLHLALKAGATLAANTKVTDIRPVSNGDEGYLLCTRGPRGRREQVHVGAVVLAAGTLGSNTLLRRLKDRAMPAISDRLGDLVRTNSEAIVAVTSRDPSADWTSSLAITTSVHPDEDTHFTNNTYGRGGDALALTFGPLTAPPRRRRAYLRAVGTRPATWLSWRRVVGWSRRTIVFTVMQSLDSAIALRPRGPLRRLDTVVSSTVAAPASFLAIANEVAAAAARITGGVPQSAVSETWWNTAATAHFIGGAVIGADPSTGVVDRYRRLFGYANFLVVDGSTLPANVGVNPSLTITALAEEAMSHIPSKAESHAVGSGTEEGDRSVA